MATVPGSQLGTFSHEAEVLGLSSTATGDKAYYLGNLKRLSGRVGIHSLWVTCRHRAWSPCDPQFSVSSPSDGEKSVNS